MKLQQSIDTIDNVHGSIIITDFSKGLNVVDSNEVLKDSEATIRQNWENQGRGEIVKVNGYTKANSTTMGAKPVRGLFRNYVSAGTKKLLAICNGKFYYSDDTGATFTQEGNSTAITETVYNSGVNYNDLFFVTNATDNLMVFTPSTNLLVAATSKPTDACKILLKRADRRLLALGNTINGSTLYFSKVDPTNSADDWSATNDYGSIAIDGAKSETLTGGMTFGSVDIIFKDYAAFRVWGYPAPQAVRISGSPGCAAPFSVAQGDGLGFHLAHDGVWMYDGNKFILISAPIEDIIDTINPSYVQNAFGVYRDGYYWLFYTESGDTVNKNCIVYDTNISNPYTGENVWFERTGLEMNCPIILQGTGDDNELYAGGSADTGFVFRLDFAADGGDNTGNISATYQTKYFDCGYPNVVKRFSKIKITYYLNTGSLTFNWYVNRGATTGNWSGSSAASGTALGSFILDTSTLAGILDTTYVQPLDDTAVGKDISLKITNNATGTAPIVRRIEIFFELLYEE